MSGISTNTDCTTTCSCNDPQVDQLRALVAAGHDQAEASRLIWGGQQPTSLPLLLDTDRRRIRATFARAFPWLRLPTTELEVS